MNKKLIIGLITVMMTLGMASAQPTGDYGDYSVSEKVTDYNIGTDNTQAFNFSNISSETVDVELLNDDSVVATVEGVQLDSTGFGYAQANTSDVEVDQVAVYPENPDNVESVTHYYNYDGTADGEGTTANYQGSQDFNTFEVGSSSIVSGSVSLQDVMGIVILMAFLGRKNIFQNLEKHNNKYNTWRCIKKW